MDEGETRRARGARGAFTHASLQHSLQHYQDYYCTKFGRRFFQKVRVFALRRREQKWLCCGACASPHLRTWGVATKLPLSVGLLFPGARGGMLWLQPRSSPGAPGSLGRARARLPTADRGGLKRAEKSIIILLLLVFLLVFLFLILYVSSHLLKFLIFPFIFLRDALAMASRNESLRS